MTRNEKIDYIVNSFSDHAEETEVSFEGLQDDLEELTPTELENAYQFWTSTERLLAEVKSAPPFEDDYAWLARINQAFETENAVIESLLMGVH